MLAEDGKMYSSKAEIVAQAEVHPQSVNLIQGKQEPIQSRCNTHDQIS